MSSTFQADAFIRAVAKQLKATDCHAYLILPGVDGRQARPAHQLLAALLKDSIGTEIHAGKLSEIEEEFVCIISIVPRLHVRLICPHRVDLDISHAVPLHICSPESSNNAIGVDEESIENFKILAFVQAFTELNDSVDSQLRVAVPVSCMPEQSDLPRDFPRLLAASAVEKWPLIQAFALQEYSQLGFFTMAFDVRDASAGVQQLLSHPSPRQVLKAHTVASTRTTAAWKQLTTMLESSSLRHRAAMRLGDACGALRAWAELQQLTANAHLRCPSSGDTVVQQNHLPDAPLQIGAFCYDGREVHESADVSLSELSHLRVSFRDSCSGLGWTRCIRLSGSTDFPMDSLYDVLVRFSALFLAACNKYFSRLLGAPASERALQAAVRKAAKTAVLLSPIEDVLVIAQAIGVDPPGLSAACAVAGGSSVKTTLGKAAASDLADVCAEAIESDITCTSFSGLVVWSSCASSAADSGAPRTLPSAVILRAGVSLKPDKCINSHYAWPKFADSMLLTPTAAPIPIPSGALQAVAHSVLSGVAPASHKITSGAQALATHSAGVSISKAEAASLKQIVCACGDPALLCECVLGACAPQQDASDCLALLDATGALSGMSVAALTDNVPKWSCFASSDDDLERTTQVLQSLSGPPSDMSLGAAAASSATADRAGHVRIRGGAPLDMLSANGAGSLVAISVDSCGAMSASCSHSLASVDIREHGVVVHTMGSAPMVLSMHQDVQRVFTLSEEEWRSAASGAARAGQAGIWASLAPISQMKQAVACLATKAIVSPSTASPSASFMWKQLPKAAHALGQASAGEALADSVLSHFLGHTASKSADRPRPPKVFGFSLSDDSKVSLAAQAGVYVPPGGEHTVLLLLVLHPEAAAVTPLQSVLAQWRDAVHAAGTSGEHTAVPRVSSAAAAVAGMRGMVAASHGAVLRALAHTACFAAGEEASSEGNSSLVQSPLPSAVAKLPVSVLLLPGSSAAHVAQASHAICSATASSMHWIQCQIDAQYSVVEAVERLLPALLLEIGHNPGLSRVASSPSVLCRSDSGNHHEVLDSHSQPKQIGACIRLPPFWDAAEFATVLDSVCGFAAALKHGNDWPLRVAGGGGNHDIDVLMVLRGIVPVVELSDLFSYSCPGIPSPWLACTCRHPATRHVLVTHSLQTRLQKSAESISPTPAKATVSSAAARAPPVPGSALAAVLAAAGASPFAAKRPVQQEIQAEQASDEASAIEAYHQRKRREQEARFPSAQRAADTWAAAQALLKHYGTSLTHLSVERGSDVTHTDVSAYLENVGPLIPPTVTLTFARMAINSCVWPLAPVQPADTAGYNQYLKVASEMFPDAILLAPLLDWRRHALSDAPPSSSPAAALRPASEAGTVLEFAGHLKALVPGQAAERTVFIQGRPSCGVWCTDTSHAPASLGVPPLGQVFMLAHDGEADMHYLKSVMSGFLPPAAPEQPPFAPAQLSRAQRLALVKHRRHEPLPDGIMYDGQCFRDALGGTLLQHPKQQQFVGDFITWANEQVAAANRERTTCSADGAAASYWHSQQFPELTLDELLCEYIKP